MKHPNKIFFGRRQARALKPHQKELLQILNQKHQEEALPNNLSLLQGADFLSSANKLSLEIGFGSGDFLANVSQKCPNEAFIGCEPYANGILSLIHKIKEGKMKNVKVTQCPIQELLRCIPSESLDNVYILFPDPWPKKRHYKRRLVQKQFMRDIFWRLKADGRLVIATDHEDYKIWVKKIMSSDLTIDESLEHELDRDISSSSNPRSDKDPTSDLNASRRIAFEFLHNEKPFPEISTKYERKAIQEGRVPQYFIYKKSVSLEANK